MNNLHIKLHEFQAAILKKLTMTPQLKSNQLLIDGLESEHMNYHLKKLIEFELVQKDGDKYELTDSGKDYSNLMDDNVEIIEKQPKTSVLIRAIRKNEETGEIEHLMSKRLRQPYFGKVGRLGGKVRFGETLEQAAARELYEETGLTASNWQMENIYHKLRYRPDGEFVQDILFYGFVATELSGEFITKTPHQENFWISNRELAERKDLDLYDDLVLDDLLFEAMKGKLGLEFSESVGVVSGY